MFKLSTRLCVAVAAAGLCVGSASAASLIQPENRQGAGQPRRGGEGMSVEGAMKTMNRSLRQLRAVIGDASKKDDALRLVGDMQRGCLAAKSQPVPHDVLEGAKDEAAKSKLAGEFRHELIDLMRHLLDLEMLIDAGKTEEAGAKLTEIVKLRDHAHEEMGVREEQPGAPRGAKPEDRD